jgi:hypothetical protein
MVLREPNRALVLTEVVQADRPRVLDQQAEEPLALGQMSDGLDGGRVDADVNELLEAGTFRGDNSQAASTMRVSTVWSPRSPMMLRFA